MDDQADRQPEPPDDEPSRSDLRLLRGALRQDWPIPPEVKQRVLQRLVDYLDRDSIEGAAAPSRTVVMAARTLASFCDLTLRQQAIDFQRERHKGKSRSDVSPADVVAEAERRAEERIREREREREDRG